MTKSEITQYFKTVPLGYAYFLTTLDGVNRTNLLEITKDLYYDKERAYRWYLNIKEELVKLDNPYMIDITLTVLNSIYDNMIEY